MHLRESGSAVVVRAPAKVNLFLEVLGKRPDGYHEIATLMVALRLYDTLVFRSHVGDELELQCDRADLTTGPDNLILKAARLLQEKTQTRRGARIRLVKRIPMAAGLAGGSTDAAATLLGLNRLWRLDRSPDELARWSSEIGSDIPFFFHTPAAFCTGRGEKVTPVPLGQVLDLVLVCPRAGLSTATVYRGVVVPNKPLNGEEMVQALAAGDIESLGKLLFNRLQLAAENLSPAVARWHRRLQEAAPAGQLMSGSGSTLFALCRNRQEAEDLARRMTALTHRATAQPTPGGAETGEEDAEVFLVRSQG